MIGCTVVLFLACVSKLSSLLFWSFCRNLHRNKQISYLWRRFNWFCVSQAVWLTYSLLKHNTVNKTNLVSLFVPSFSALELDCGHDSRGNGGYAWGCRSSDVNWTDVQRCPISQNTSQLYAHYTWQTLRIWSRTRWMVVKLLLVSYLMMTQR
jgi:hypothetical protein